MASITSLMSDYESNYRLSVTKDVNPKNECLTFTESMESSPRRSSSLIRYKNRSVKNQEDKTDGHLRRSHYDTKLLKSSIHEDFPQNTNLPTFTIKESSSRRILNFLQRGFQTRRPKSITKSERRKFLDSYIRSNECINCSSWANQNSLTAEQAIQLLGEQIDLPDELYSTFCTHPTDINSCRKNANVRLQTIDASLFGRKCGHCFQVMSFAPYENQNYDRRSSLLQFRDSTYESVQPSSRRNELDPLEKVQTYACNSALERERWIQFLKRVVNPNQDLCRRTENCLYIWIQEAKGLLRKHWYCCLLLVNGRVYAKTTVKKMSEMLFWGEEFDLSGLHDYSSITIELWEIPSDSRSGSPSLPRYRIQSSPTSNFVRRQNSTSGNHSTICHVSNSPVRLRKTMMTCTRPANDRDSISPEDNRDQTHIDHFDYYKQCKAKQMKTSKLSRPQLVATIQIGLINVTNTGEVESWYTSNLNDAYWSANGRRKVKHNLHQDVNSPVQLRIKIRHRALTVLPLSSYARLKHFLSHVEKFEPNSEFEKPGNLVHLLCSLDPWLNVKAKAELAGAMILLQQALGHVTEFLTCLILCEVYKQDDINMVLRANSTATKATEIYLRLIGENYLQNLLTKFVQTVIYGSKSTPSIISSPTLQLLDYEVDISKLQCSSQLAQNQLNLLNLVDQLWKRILASVPEFPRELRAVFAAIRENMELNVREMGNSQHQQQIKQPCAISDLASTRNCTASSMTGTLIEHVISSCLFLRYICPAILSPSLFNLIHEFPSEARVLRAFTLVAKTIQTLANFSHFDDTKEAYMTFMNRFVSSETENMKQFLRQISAPLSDTNTDSFTTINRNISDGLDNEQCSMRILNSHTNHNGFHNGDHRIMLPVQSMNNMTSVPITRSSSGLPNVHKEGDLKNTNSEQCQNRMKLSHSSSPSRRPREFTQGPILLPPLPINHGSRFDKEIHVDLPLCLAMCHFHLSGAVKKVPEDRRTFDMRHLKEILDEIDQFLINNVDPQPEWWQSKIEYNLPITKFAEPEKKQMENVNSSLKRTSPTKISVEPWQFNCDSSTSLIDNWNSNTPSRTDQQNIHVKHREPENSEMRKLDDYGSTYNENATIKINQLIRSPKVSSTELAEVARTNSDSKFYNQLGEVLPSDPSVSIIPKQLNTEPVQPVPTANSSSAQSPSIVQVHSVTNILPQESPQIERPNYSSSSGYQSLASYLNIGACPNVDSQQNEHIYATMVGALSNPLYTCQVYHKKKGRDTVTLSGDDVIHSQNSSCTLLKSPSDVSLTNLSCPTQSDRNNVRGKVMPNSSRRHTYVNLANTRESELALVSLRETQSDKPDQQPSSSLEVAGTNLSSDEMANPVIIKNTDAPPLSIAGPLSHPLKLGQSRSVGPHLGRRINHANCEKCTLDDLDIQTALDESQARLAEAQARLLMNEAERIQLLRTCQSELMKQSQLINANVLGNFHSDSLGEKLRHVGHEKDTLVIQDIKSLKEYPATSLQKPLKLSKSLQPRMGASAVASSSLHDHQFFGPSSPSDYLQSSLPREKILTSRMSNSSKSKVGVPSRSTSHSASIPRLTQSKLLSISIQSIEPQNTTVNSVSNIQINASPT